MKRSTYFLAKVFGICLASSGILAGAAGASNCPLKWQHAYETGVRDGGVDGAHGRESDPARHGRHFLQLVDKGKSRGDCYVEGYNIGWDNAVADVQTRGSHSYSGAPNKGTNERAYYDDGCRDGTGDAKMGMSMMYERHEGYNSRFEPYFRQGYEACWSHYR